MKQLSVLIKPASSLCNMRCSYCFYADVAENRALPSYGLMSEVIRPHSYLYAFLITLVFSLIVLLMTRKSIRDIEMVESLKSVE